MFYSSLKSCNLLKKVCYTCKLYTILIILTVCCIVAEAQTIPGTTASQMEQSIQKRHVLRQKSLMRGYPVRNVGPVVMSGRITDIAVDPNNTSKFYVAYASGGVFKTINRGQSMIPIFDNQGALTIGDIAISTANPNHLWVGTGENNSSRSSYAGAGIYRSTDGGETWQFAGLRHAQHIGRIITHPTDTETIWVASLGSLYSKNTTRGVYKTKDGGKTWERTLYINDMTGVIDLIIHPQNPNILWASTWERARKAWDFQESGEGSAIYRSIDGGETWIKSISGFPQGNHVGRIGLTINHSNANILYASVDNQEEIKTAISKEKGVLYRSDLLKMSADKFLKLDDEKINDFLKEHNFPEKYTTESIKKDIKESIYKPKDIALYIGDANSALFDTDVRGIEVYRSDDGGISWIKTHEPPIKNVYYTYGYYFGEIRVDPYDDQTVYIMGVPMLKSKDGGKTWKDIARKDPVHVDHQALWIDPNDTEHLLLGNDGGLYESYDGGEHFIHHNIAPVGQFYTIAIDWDTPYNIYGGLQDNGVYVGSSQHKIRRGNYWTRLLGGDGMHIQVRPDNSDIVYTGYQFGNYFKIDRSTNSYTSVKPRHDIGEEAYRYNWNTPVYMSTHNPDILYFGTQYLLRTLDGGSSWEKISPDLTSDTHRGDVPYGTITSISESHLQFGLIWAGTDDGHIHVTQNGGITWKDVSQNLPNRRWVSEIIASPHDKNTAFVSLNGYRYDEFVTYIYKTEDMGRSWLSLKGNLPDEVINIIVQDPVIPDILYVGGDHGTYVSFDGGKEWNIIPDIPNAASYDMVVHPRDYELVVGTHGRSIYVLDVKPLHKLSQNIETHVMAFEPKPIKYSDRWGEQPAYYRPRIEPEVNMLYFCYQDGRKSNDILRLSMVNEKNKSVFKTTLPCELGYRGFQTYTWNLLIDEKRKKYLEKGKYTITLTYLGSASSVTLEVK